MNFSILCDNIVHAFTDSYHFDPRGIYCQVTGKRIGTTDETEFCYLVASLTGDLEAICDDIAIRLLASLRPSMRWNKMRAESLKEMADLAPVDTMAYLLNRLFAPIDSRKTSLDKLLAVNEDKIRLHVQLTRWGMTPELVALSYQLLEIDAKWGLDSEASPTSCDAFIMAIDHPERLALFATYHARRMKDWEAKVKHDEQVTRWHRSGNALAKPAFFAAFMRDQPMTATQKAKAIKQDEKDFFANILNEVMGKPNLAGEKTFSPKPMAKPVMPTTRAPMNWGKKA